jgi:hypothetical protein
MNTSLVFRILSGSSAAAIVLAAQSAFGTLLLNYQFEEVTGSPPSATTPDSSGAVPPLTGAVTGGPTVGTNYPTIVTTPFVSNGSQQSLNPNHSMQFFGGTNISSGSSNSANRVVVADAGVNSSTLDALFPQFTFAAWLNPAEVTTATRWIAGKMGGGGERGWQLARGYGTGGANVNNLEFSYFDGPSGASQDLSVTGFFSSNSEWIHLAVVFDGGDFVKIYKNGVEVLNETAGVLSNLNGANAIPFMVGHRGTSASSSGAWFGYMDDVRIYDSALNQAEVSALLVVPEPSSMVLMAGLIVGVTAIGLRRKSQQCS